MSSKFTLNYGLRLEHEDGLAEKNDRITVAFDRTLNPGGALGNVVVNGQPVRGGLVYAGVNGANAYQGDPPAMKFSPRLGVVYSLNPKTVIRAGYGIYWAPWNYQAPSSTNYGQIGFSQVTLITQGRFAPTCTLSNPFPNGVLSASRQRPGRADRCRQRDRVHRPGQEGARRSTCTRWTSTASCPATSRWASSTPAPPAATSGSAARNDGSININQVPTRAPVAGRGAAPTQVPNPFFGLPAGQGFAVTSPTVRARQLLRPFPQFGNILMRQIDRRARTSTTRRSSSSRSA